MVTAPADGPKIVGVVVPALLILVVQLDVVGRAATARTPGHAISSSEHGRQNVTVSPIPNSCASHESAVLMNVSLNDAMRGGSWLYRLLQWSQVNV
jgi:hypothetical protein